MPSPQWACPECGKVLLKKNLYTHLASIHLLTPAEVARVKEEISRKAGVAAVVCPLCCLNFVSYESLASHCQKEHADDGADGRPQDYSLLDLNFDSVQEYECWFQRQCSRTCSSFHTTRSVSHESCKRVRLLCNRAGVYTNTSTKRMSTTKRDVRHCSCHLLVDYHADGTVTLKGCLGHAEHSFNYIINRLRKEDPTRSSKLSFVIKSDLRNIVARFKMSPGWRHDDDVTSLKLRHDEGNVNDGIRFFEAPKSSAGPSMVVITPTMVEWLKKYSSKGVSLDDTFHTTRYNMKLATLMVTDERDRGLPAAFLLSGTMTSADVEKLFIEVRKLMPEFSPKTLVTDEAPCFYNGFRAVFPEAPTRLHFCRFHIWQTWERKTKELVDASCRSSVSRALELLLREAQLNVFERKFAEILVFLKEKGQTAMSDYLEKNYLGRTTTWASFSNRDAVLDTTMISERFHLRIKDEFLHRNGNSRLDALVDLLIKCVEDLSGSIEVKERRRLVTCSFRLEETHKCHRLARDIYKGKEEMITEAGENHWHILNRDRTKTYEVFLDGQCFCHHTKNTHCVSCGVCAYTWRCTCLDNRSGISCHHRHAVKMFAHKEGNSGLPEASVSDAIGETSTAQEDGSCAYSSEVQSTAISGEEEHRQARYQTLNAIRDTYAVVEAAAKSLARMNTDEAKMKLDEILAHLQLAADVAQPYTSTSYAPRPEMTQIGGKPKIAKIPLRQRKKKTQQKKPALDLHKEVQEMAGRDTSAKKGTHTSS